MQAMRRAVGRIERRLRRLPTFVVVLGSCLLGMLLTLFGETTERSPSPKMGEVWFPVPGGGGRLVQRTKQKTCQLTGWDTRQVNDLFLAVKKPERGEGCTCLETLAVVAERGAPLPSCDTGGKVSYGAH